MSTRSPALVLQPLHGLATVHGFRLVVAYQTRRARFAEHLRE